MYLTTIFKAVLQTVLPLRVRDETCNANFVMKLQYYSNKNSIDNGTSCAKNEIKIYNIYIHYRLKI